MALIGARRTHIRYDMFDFERDGDACKRFARCESIYHRTQQLAWNGKEILPMLVAQHGRIELSDDKRAALQRVFAIILWGELAAWKISAQLADRLVPLEAKMAATGQAFDEARHFYTMHDYLALLGDVPKRMDRAPQALLELVLETDNLAYKLLGMQLMVETMALGIFQAIRESRVEPVLCDLMKYYERDEARHVGLGMQYLPDLLRQMTPAQVTRMTVFQARLMTLALWETKLLRTDFEVLGIDPRATLERVRKKQTAALVEAYASVGIAIDRHDNPINRVLDATVELMFPPEGAQASNALRASRAFDALWARVQPEVSMQELTLHEQHRIKTERGWVGGESTPPGPSPAE